VKALTSVLNASAIDRPTATTTRFPCMRKFLKPLRADIAAPFAADEDAATIRQRLRRVRRKAARRRRAMVVR
jgi:hypothetical protein